MYGRLSVCKLPMVFPKMLEVDQPKITLQLTVHYTRPNNHGQFSKYRAVVPAGQVPIWYQNDTGPVGIAQPTGWFILGQEGIQFFCYEKLARHWNYYRGEIVQSIMTRSLTLDPELT